jgi:hypothetical protein
MNLDPALFAGAILVEACDIPVDMTIGDWRKTRPAPPRPRRRFLWF